MDADLIPHGLRVRDLGNGRFTWGDLLALIQHRPRGSALSRALDPRAEWSVTDYLLANAADALAWLVWAKTKDGSKNRNRPKPIPRPGSVEDNGRMTDVQSMDVDELKAFLARPRVAV